MIKRSKKTKKIASKPKTKKKALKKSVTKIKKVENLGKPIGVVTHFYNKIKVAIFKFKKLIKIGTKIRIKGATTNFEEVLKSIQIDHKSVMIAPKGKFIGIKVAKRARVGDLVYEIKK
ncbi:MAG: hypothetical protein EXS49_01245 [Candidatus Pacebacteria bacterium]|nr:hypothetical protein [Candidatus Paceibacterota bacterium]